MFVKGDPVDVCELLDAASVYVIGEIAYLGDAPSTQEFKALFVDNQ